MARTYVSVIGGSVCTAEVAALGERLGELLAERGCVVVCGGMSGVMEAVARGARRAAASASACCRVSIAPEPRPTSRSPCSPAWATPATSRWWRAATS